MRVETLFRQSLYLALVLALATSAAWGQEKGKVPKPKSVSRETKDGLELVAIYYASDRGKEAVPVILLHDWGGSAADYKNFAEFLQQQGCAVLVPDLRGHGESTRFSNGKEIHQKRMPVSQCHGMYRFDVEACKEFLIKENNAQKLNIEKLCVVGAGLGAVVAMNWAVIDWSWMPVAGHKQGQDVQALVLLSPPWTEKTVTVNKVIALPVVLNKLTHFIIVGKKGSAAADANKIHKRLDAARPGESPKEKNLFFYSPDTNRQGVELLGPANLEVAKNIQQFISERLQETAGEWKERKNPLASD